MKKNPVYFVWYELIVGTERSRLTFELTYSDLFKRAETKEEMFIIHNTATIQLTKHHGGEGLTVNITGMQWLRDQKVAVKSESKNDGRKTNNSRTPQRKSGVKR